MIYTQKTPGGAFRSVEECEEFIKTEIEPLKITSYEEYLDKGHEWCWALVGNIVEEHEFGEDHEIKKGTKHFSGGTKVYIAPVQWGDGYERIIVIGKKRGNRNYAEVIMQSKYVENFRIQKVYKPVIVKRMLNSENIWWSDSEDDCEEIINYLEKMLPKDTKKQINE